MNHWTLNALASQLNEPWISSYQPESDAIFAAMIPTPSIARKQAIDNFVRSLKNLGIFSLLDCLKVFAAHSEQAAHVNWVSPSLVLGDLRGGASWVADTHFKGASAEGSAIDTGFTPSVAAKMSKRNSEIGVNLSVVPTFPAGSGAKRVFFGASTMPYVPGDTLEQHHAASLASHHPWVIAYRRNENRLRAGMLTQYMGTSAPNIANSTGLYSVTQENVPVSGQPNSLPITAYRTGFSPPVINVVTPNDTAYNEPNLSVFLGAVNMPGPTYPQEAHFSSNAGFNLFYAGKVLSPSQRAGLSLYLATYLAAL